MNDRRYIHALNSAPGMGPQTLRKILTSFDTPESAWKASFNNLSSLRIHEKTIRNFLHYRSQTDVSDKWNLLKTFGIELITETDTAYPNLLKEIHNPPFALYKRGSFDFNSKPLIAMVGSRHASAYGKRVAESLASELVVAGYGIVSGLAFGIDEAAHKGTLIAQGNTVAVLGNSLDDASISPKTHLSLSQSILNRNGALLSEYSPVTPSSPFTFPARNRIIAGMTQGTIVIEAAQKSGSLITARYALEYNREVFAVPGSIFAEGSSGPHALIRSGAKLIGSVRDIIEELVPMTENSPKTIMSSVPLSLEESTLFSLFSKDPIHIDKILKITTLETPQTQSLLVTLELKGLIRNIGSMHYVRI